jgi:Secretion system C-terminal sorting domain
LQIKILSFSASLQNINNANLQWKIATAEEGGKYELQRNTDGRSFLPINLQTGNSSLTQFSYADKALPNGTYYYRLKITDKDGKVTYSNVAIVKVGSKEQLIAVYPNPVKIGESLQVSLQNITAGKIEIINATGQVVYSNTAKQTGSISIPIAASLAPGQYVVRVISENKVGVQKILIY